jgi:16S rRNA (cytosine967-C5)-methyltransferase
MPEVETIVVRHGRPSAPPSAPSSAPSPADVPAPPNAPRPPSSRPRVLDASATSAPHVAPGAGGRARPYKRGGTALPVTARNVAAEVVSRVERDGSYAAAVLDAELKKAVQLASRDRALATELVYGTLRLRPLLERSIESVTPRGISALDPRTRAILLVSAYQIHYTRIPAFAAVSEAVEAIRTTKGRVVAGFANGALRQVALQAQSDPLPRMPVAFRDATSPWLRRALERSIGEDATEALLTAGPYPPPLTLRVSHKEDRDAWIERLHQAMPQATFEKGQYAPRAIRVRGAGDPHVMPGYAEGAWTIQEEGSQLVGMLLGARPGDIVLDACAGRGNKSSLLAEALIDAEGKVEGRIDVADLHPDKLARLGHELARLGLPKPATFGVDWAIGSGDLPHATYDRVLVDAPCSGTGTIRRRPEVQTRRQAADLTALTTLQATILTNAVAVVRPGGRLLYAVCSVLRDECEAVVATAMERRKDLEPVAFDVELASELFSPGATQGRILTHLHGTDSYFVASLRRKN